MLVAVREGLLALLAEGSSHGYQLKVDFEAATGGVWPDLTILLRIDPESTATRIGRRKADRFEGEGIVLQRLVAEGYDEIARRHPERVRVVDADGDRESVHAALLAEVQGVRA